MSTMIIRNLDANHDWEFGFGLQNYIANDAAIGLNIETRLLSWLGDCFFDTGAGIDWANRLGSKNQLTLLRQDLMRIIAQSYGVTAILNFDTVLTGRAFTATYTVQTIFSAAYTASITQEIG